MCLLLPACSDSTGSIQTVVVICSLFGGFALGFVLDVEAAASRERKGLAKSKKHDTDTLPNNPRS